MHMGDGPGLQKKKVHGCLPVLRCRPAIKYGTGGSRIRQEGYDEKLVWNHVDGGPSARGDFFNRKIAFRALTTARTGLGSKRADFRNLRT